MFRDPAAAATVALAAANSRPPAREGRLADEVPVGEKLGGPVEIEASFEPCGDERLELACCEHDAVLLCQEERSSPQQIDHEVEFLRRVVPYGRCELPS